MAALLQTTQSSIGISCQDYTDLIKQSTIHQHAILLDLGRTFPSHRNFARKFGRGQSALFNVLKAYSLLDAEVGYCQGMSFIVGILLIHVNNDAFKTFTLLKHLLITLDLRQQYRPDMVQLQRYMYEFTRLLETRMPDLYAHFEAHDVSASLYAAPWFLTLFSSQFQIGFVARVFDLLFAEGPLALFKLSMAILSVHKPILLSCDTFESILNHLKLEIPEMSLIECELIISKAYGESSLCRNLELDLSVYEIEFNILYEEEEYVTQTAINGDAYASIGGDWSMLDRMARSPVSRSEEEWKTENERLRRELKDMREKLNSMELQLFNSDEQFFKVFNENKQIKCRIDVLEIERNSFLKKVNEQQELIKFYEKLNV